MDGGAAVTAAVGPVASSSESALPADGRRLLRRGGPVEEVTSFMVEVSAILLLLLTLLFRVLALEVAGGAPLVCCAVAPADRSVFLARITSRQTLI